LRDLLRKARLRLLRMHFESGVGHVGGNLSALELLMTLHHRVMGADDQFVLSKGHAAGALYVTLWSLGRLTDQQLREFHADGTKLAGHPVPRAIPDILFAVGSLGHGLGLASGLALGQRLLNKPGRVYCLTSDGEWNEGSNWEALTFIAQHRLHQLVLLVDLNGLQGFGTTADVANLEPLSEKLESFGFEVRELDGHDANAIELALRTAPQERPLAVLAKTVKGHGVSFMEHQLEWHYLPMTAAQYQLAVEEANRR
jgi:transketolase